MKEKRFMTSIVALLLISAAAGGREPTQLEQYYLELINRARADPAAEVIRLESETWGDEGDPQTADLNEGLAANTISGNAKQPLALDPRIITAASNYSDFLLAVESFGHTLSGTPRTRIEGQGFAFSGSSGASENLALTTSIEVREISKETIDEHHRNLFIDRNFAGRGHRINLMDPDHRELGIAIRADSDTESFFGEGFMGDIISAQDFVFSGGRFFVTGVIFQDGNGNNFFDPGESAGILDLKVLDEFEAEVASGKSFVSGGYSINMGSLPSGQYTLRALDDHLTIVQVQFAWAGGSNVKVDMINPAFTAPPVFVHSFRPDGKIGFSRAGLRGNDIYTASGAGQVALKVAKNKRVKRYFMQFENDGGDEDGIIIVGTRQNRFYRATYRQQVDGVFINVSAALVRGKTANLHKEQVTDITLEVKPKKKALGGRRNFVGKVDGISTNDRAQRDRVVAFVRNKTKRKKRRR